MARRKTALLTLLAVSVASVLSACGSGAGADGITLYNGQHEQTTARLVSDFERRTGIHVSVRSGDEAELGDEIEQEGSSSPADVFYSENTPVLEALREKGLLAPLPAATLAAVARRDEDTHGQWVGVSARLSVLIYNTAAVSPAQLPRSILELAEPRWRGKVAFAPSETDFQPLITSIARSEGTATAERWLRALAANGRSYPDNETVTEQVNNGESALGPINHYYWYRLRAEVGRSGMHSALHDYAPGDPGNLIDVSGAAVLRSSTRKADALAFIAFLVSREGQEALAHSDSFEYPLRPGVAPAPGLPPLASLHPDALSPSELGDGSMALGLEQKLGLL